MERDAHGEPLIAIDGLVKDYGATRVLDGVDFEVRAGEVHALLGENGAGKSTLIKVLAGVEPRTDGAIAVCGRALPPHPSAAEVEDAGLAFVHQDLGLIDTLTVAENLALPAHFVTRRGLISFKRTQARAREILAGLDVDVDPATVVGDLHQDQKVMVAVARAFALRARAIVLDEVSASLPTPEFERFAAAVRRSTAAGIGYVYVTHRLDEVFDLATRVTVLRDGRVVGSAPVSDVSFDQVVEWIVGAPMVQPTAVATAAGHGAGRAASGGLEVRGLAGPELTEPVTFSVRPGEIVGLCGLVGSGVGAVARLLGGAVPPAGGDALLDGTPLPLGVPHRLAAAGCAYVPADRDVAGAVIDLSIRENLFLAREPESSDGPGFLRLPRPERLLADAAAVRFGVRPDGDVDRPVATLSGGNRQKVVFGRAMRRRPRLLILEDPTQGVDIGSRAELHALMRAAAADGMAIVFASSDFEEVATQADRALVMCQGRLSRTLAGPELTSDRLAQASYEDVEASATTTEVIA
jgi:ribose transport system ATP-binding protein